MNWRAACLHAIVCLGVGFLLSKFTELEWIAGACLTSACAILVGTIAEIEDAQPGGMNNLDGSDVDIAKERGWAFFLVNMLIAIFIGAVGLYVQFGSFVG